MCACVICPDFMDPEPCLQQGTSSIHVRHGCMASYIHANMGQVTELTCQLWPPDQHRPRDMWPGGTPRPAGPCHTCLMSDHSPCRCSRSLHGSLAMAPLYGSVAPETHERVFLLIWLSKKKSRVQGAVSRRVSSTSLVIIVATLQ